MIHKEPHMKYSEFSLEREIPIGKECPSSATCGAPLCPLDENIEWRIWYPDEEICKARKFQQLDWIKNQHKIRKKTRDMSCYFGPEMLKRNCIIGRGIRGLDPDLPSETEEQRIEEWLAKHPEKKGISPERREELTKRMREVRARRKRPS